LSRVLAAKSKGEIRIAGSAPFSPTTVTDIYAAAPEVVLFDSLTTALSTDDLILSLRRSLPNLKVVLFSMDCDEEKFLLAVHRGIVGFVLKDASARELSDAIRAVARGEAVCPPLLCRALFESVARTQSWQPGLQVRKNLGFTRREQQLIQLVSHGLTNKEIGTQLCLSEQTIKNHLRRMLRKIGATDRLEAVEVCRALGFWA
jgi:two-component system, NarL family, nitrate/nitrite response regulator NarL